MHWHMYLSPEAPRCDALCTVMVKVCSFVTLQVSCRRRTSAWSTWPAIRRQIRKHFGRYTRRRACATLCHATLVPSLNFCCQMSSGLVCICVGKTVHNSSKWLAIVVEMHTTSTRGFSQLLRKVSQQVISSCT